MVFQTKLDHWCLPEGAVVDIASSVVCVEAAHSEAEAIQAPYSLHRSKAAISNHFINNPLSLLE